MGDSTSLGLLRLQWHITERCNLHCVHCYQDSSSGEEIEFRGLINILHQYKDLLDKLSRNRTTPVRGHITVTGGEPFVRKDFLNLLDVFHANKDRFSFAILTNGTYIDEAMARRLRKLNPAFVQVSIEGTKATNDKIRGPEAYEQTISALKNLVENRIYSMISFTSHRNNFHEFTDVAHLGCELRVSRVWADRLIPWGTGSALNDQMLSIDETREFFEIMYKAHSEAMRNFSCTDISMHRALQFLVAGGQPYQCGAGDILITIQPNGDLYPCRRMPIRVGNVMETPLTELYYENKLFRDLRDKERISDGCEDCSFARQCRGGLKCLSYAVTGDPFKADPGCWRAVNNHQTA